MNHTHVHVGQGLPINYFGGSYTVMRNLAVAQSKLEAHQSYLVTNISLFSRKFYKIDHNGQIVPTEKIVFNNETIFHFHFSFTMLKFIIQNPKVLRNTRVYHFHGPWYRESQFQGDNLLKVYLKKLIERFCFKLVHIIFCASDAFREVLLNEYGRIEKKSFVIPLGVDFESFNSGKSIFEDFPIFKNEFPVIGSIRRLVPRMGLENLLNAVAVNGKVNLVIAGHGPLKDSLIDLSRTLGISDRVRFLGGITEVEKREFYKRIKLLVVPSIALEGFGLVVLEAMSCGTPVLSSNVDGLSEAMGPFALTNTFSNGNPAILAEKIDWFLSDVFAMDKNRYRSYARTRNWTKVADELEAILCT